MERPDGQRRLAAIVAVDVAGYARRTEADEAGAVYAVKALAREADNVAAAHEGRVFNTAGDGFMLEFQSVSSALEAAVALAARAPAPVRTGVHLGEVHATATGDLLGHGVNVAARLQALAQPGSILVSDAARQAARGPVADALIDQGRMRLDKMHETMRVFAVKGVGPAGAKAVRRTRTRLIWAAAGGVAAVLIGLGLWIGAGLLTPSAAELKTAVRDFSVEGAGVDPKIGVALADSVTAALSERHAPAVSRALVSRGDTGGARLLVGGEILKDGATVRVHAHIDDAKAGVILWSADFERAPEQADALQDALSTKVADLLDLLHQDVGAHGAQLNSQSLSAFLQAEDISRLSYGQSDAEKREAWRRVVALAPGFSPAHAALAAFDLYGLKALPADARAARVAEARAQIATALALNPQDSNAFLASSYLPDDLATNESWLIRGLAIAPESSRLNYSEATIMADTGRIIESLPMSQRALDEDPLSRVGTLQVVFNLMEVGRLAEARALNARARRLWPDYAAAQMAELYLDLVYGDQNDGEAALAEADKGQLPLSRADVAAWRQVLAARAGRLPPVVAARALVRAAKQDGQLDLGLEVTALSQLGAVDLAFSELDRGMARRAKFYPNTLFEPPTANLRKDPRFMPLAARMGFTRYWRKTGHWPDYCASPDLPYRCPAAAAEAEAHAQPAG